MIFLESILAVTYENKSESITIYEGESFEVIPYEVLNTNKMLGTFFVTDFGTCDKTAFTYTTRTIGQITNTINVNGLTKHPYFSYNFTALKEGNYKIDCGVYYYKSIASYKSHEDPLLAKVVYDVKVLRKPVVKAIYLPSSLDLNLGDSYTLNPIIYEEGAETELSWITSDPSIAIVNNGILKATGCGKVVITCCSSNGISTKCDVTVSPIKVANIVTEKEYFEIEKGETLLLHASVMPDNATNKNLVWESNNTSCAVVDNLGHVTAIFEGVCVITVSAIDNSGVSSSVKIKVVNSEKKCSTPIIEFKNGGISIICDTQNSTCHNSCELIQNSDDGVFSMLKITSYASATGCQDSDPVTKTIDLKEVITGDINNDGIISIQDANIIVNKFLGK